MINVSVNVFTSNGKKHLKGFYVLSEQAICKPTSMPALLQHSDLSTSVTTAV